MKIKDLMNLASDVREALEFLGPSPERLFRPMEDRMSSVISVLVSDFVARVVATVEAEIYGRLTAAVNAALPNQASRDVSTWTPFRNAKPGVVAALGRTKTRPKQLCPVPGCEGVAVPIFGMVCTQHKNVAKSKIAKYRKARKAKLEMKTPAEISAPKAPRKPRATVYCPVPGCKGIAAPVFKMMCRDHKDVAPSKVAKYRKARKEAKRGEVGKPTAVEYRKVHAMYTTLGRRTKTSLKLNSASKVVDKKVDKKADKKADKQAVKKTVKTVGDKAAKKVDKLAVKKTAKKTG